MSAPHLTAEMKDAALRYAARLKRQGQDPELALDEGTRLARLNLLTADGEKKVAGKSKRGHLVRQGDGKVPDDDRVTPRDRQTFRAQDPKAKGCTLGKDDAGFYCYTHRARSKSHPTPAIPVSEIRFIESTG